MDELKPCPFCGETPDADNPDTFQSSQGRKWGYVVCCGQGPEVRTGYRPVSEWKDDAIAWWNSRSPDPAVVELVRAARALELWSNPDGLEHDKVFADLRAALSSFTAIDTSTIEG